MIDIARLAAYLHRERHPGGQVPPLTDCPFHDRAVLTERARRLAVWLARDPR
ncbi:hypothetical protein [Streptomyces sp. NPDC046925]|uniref:hypothetical protein n=1 Tax=Streptomyces sp. NPDC046925 TaxID=3155375 RepID=UPI0033EB15A1